ICTCSALFWLKAFSQSVQWNGRSPADRRFGHWLGLAKAFSHLKEGPRSMDASVLSRRGCTLRCVARLKAFLHTGQTWMRSRPWAALLCCSSRPAEAKLQPHSRHACSRASFSGAPPGARLAETSVTCNGAESQPNR
uniref:Uncharacterized protein n=1 Tax=Bos indicus x Bos taurus TaxID=30522 RepID=A0A4W2DRP8_BOBOX